MKQLLVRLALPLLVLAAATVAAGCSSSEDAGGPTGTAAAEQAQQEQAVVIDVRSPEEFAAAHVVDAENINFESSDFASRVGQLDPAATYVVYCRSGRRSALAATEMRSAGLTVLDAGGMQNMLDAGYEQA